MLGYRIAFALVGSVAAWIALVPSRVWQNHTNIALHRPYTMEPAPNYALTTDPGDAEQLTDGAYTPQIPGKPLWTIKSTVGWVNRPRIAITVDLGDDQPISGASVNTAAGSAGAGFPNIINVQTSMDK